MQYRISIYCKGMLFLRRRRLHLPLLATFCHLAYHPDIGGLKDAIHYSTFADSSLPPVGRVCVFPQLAPGGTKTPSDQC